jgi:hypothetical protein
MMIDFSEVHFSKALPPILVTRSGMAIDVSEVHPLKVPFSIVVTLDNEEHL